MALEKSIEVGNTGMICEYLKVFGFIFEGESPKVQVQLALFPNASASADKKDPVSRINIDFALSELSGEGDFRAQVYEVLKTKEDFADAVDV